MSHLIGLTINFDCQSTRKTFMISIDKHIEIFNNELALAKSYDDKAGLYSCNLRNRALQECYRQIAYIMVQNMSKGTELLNMLDAKLCY